MGATETEKRRGRPPMYDNPEEIQKKIDQYFDEEVGYIEVKDRFGNPVIEDEDSGKVKMKVNHPTVTGLALYLGFADRVSLYDYKQKEDFAYTIKRAISKIEDYAEQQLHSSTKTPTGAIFWLKNHGWKDNKEITGGDGKPLLSGVTINVVGEEVEDDE